MKIRRVVTGHSPDGKAIVVSDMEVDPSTIDLRPASEYHELWSADEAPTVFLIGARRSSP